MRHFALRCALLISIVLVALASGCAKHIKPQGKLLGGYEEFGWMDTPNMKVRLYQEPDLTFRPIMLTREEEKDRKRQNLAIPTPVMYQMDVSTSQPLLLVIDAPEWATADQLPEEKMDKMLFTLRERLYRYALRQYPHPVRVRYAWTPEDRSLSGYRVVHVRSRITDFDLGNGWGRYMLGFGAGASQIQIEGELIDRTPEPALLGEYVIREDHGGYAQWGINVKVFSGTYVMKYAIEEAVDRLMKEMPDLVPGARIHPRFMVDPDPTRQFATATR